MKQFINDNVTRCTNSDCKNKNNCKRFVQKQLDDAQGYYPKSSVRYNDKNCEKIIKFK